MVKKDLNLYQSTFTIYTDQGILFSNTKQKVERRTLSRLTTFFQQFVLPDSPCLIDNVFGKQGQKCNMIIFPMTVRSLKMFYICMNLLFFFFLSWFTDQLRHNTVVVMLTQTHITISSKILLLHFQRSLHYAIEMQLIGEPNPKTSFCYSTQCLGSSEGTSTWMGADSDRFTLPVP